MAVLLGKINDVSYLLVFPALINAAQMNIISKMAVGGVLSFQELFLTCFLLHIGMERSCCMRTQRLLSPRWLSSPVKHTVALMMSCPQSTSAETSICLGRAVKLQ